MISIPSEDVDTLDETAQVTIFTEVIAWAAEAYPDLFDGARAPSTLELIQRSIARAHELEIDAVFDVIRFVDLVIRCGEDFESRPRFLGLGRTLAQTAVPGAVRLDIVESILRRRTAKR